MAAVAPSASESRTGSLYHELFCSPDADVILRSTDGVLFRVHSYTLRTTSGLFRTMFSLPQPDTSSPEPLPTHETSEILTLLLLLLSGRLLPRPIRSWNNEIECVLALAEAWDAPGAIYAIRPVLSSPRMLEENPLLVYACASHFGWKEERKLASSYTLALDLFGTQKNESDDKVSLAFQRALEKLSSKDLLALIKLRRRRCEMFFQLIDSTERFSAGNSLSYLCARCGVTPIDNRTWKVLKNALKVEFDRRPLGDGIVGGPVHGIGGQQGGLGVIGWPEAEASWQAVCTKDGCAGLNYDRNATLNQIKSCVEALPLCVEDED